MSLKYILLVAGVGAAGLGVLLLSRRGAAKPPDDELTQFREECMPSGLVIASGSRGRENSTPLGLR